MNRILAFFASPLLWAALGAMAALLLVAAAARYVRMTRKLQRQSRLLGARLRDMGEMAVEEARITLVHCTREPRRLFGMELPLMREQCIFAVDVVVKAGFNFDEIHAQVDNLRRRITLRLPEMRILSSAVDYGTMQIYDEKTGVFARPRLEWHKESMLELCHEAEAKSRVYGILDRAQASAQMRLTAFVGQICDLSEYELLIIHADGERTVVTPAEKRIGA